MSTAVAPNRPSSSPIDGEDEVVLRLGDLVGAAEAEAGAAETAVGQPRTAPGRSGSRCRADRPTGRARCRRASARGRRAATTTYAATANSTHADQQVARRARWRPTCITTKSAKNSSDEPRSRLADHHDDGEAPGEQRSAAGGVARAGGTARPSTCRLAISSRLLGEVAGEEDRQRQLGELAGLEVDRAEADPDAGAADAGADAGHERQHQQADAGEQERPPVAGEVGGALDDDERQRRTRRWRRCSTSSAGRRGGRRAG